LRELVLKIGSGATPTGGGDAYLARRDEYALIRSQNVFDHYFDHVGLAFISAQQAEALRAARVHSRDLLLNITGDGITFGRACLAPDEVLPACVNQHVSIVRVDPTKCLPNYLLGYLTLPRIKQYIESFNAGGSRRAITKGHIESFMIPLPPRPEQERIAEFVGATNDKIEQNRRTSRALERVARATFKAWFVDFEPVKAKAAGAASFPGMPDAAFAALPDRLTDAQIGPVPQGWEVRPLSKVADFLNGLALQKYPPAGDDTDLPVIKIAELRRGSSEGSALANANVPDAYVIEDGDLLFSWSGTLEADLWFGGRGVLNQHVFKVTSDNYPLWLCLCWVRQHLPEFRLIASSKATTMGHIKRGHLDDATVVVPDATTLAAAEDVIGRLYTMVTTLGTESRLLANLRDFLLPRLLRGRVRVCA
jgi:type I restriction enzyme S subunit